MTEKGKQTLQVLDSLVRMASGRYGELTPLGARQHEGIAKRMFTNFPDVFKGPAEIDARSTIVIRCILSMMAECKQLLSMNPSLRIKNDASYHDMYYMNYEDSYFDSLRNNPIVQSKILEFERANTHPERLMKSLFNDEDYVKWKIDSFELMHSLFCLLAICKVLIQILISIPYLLMKNVMTYGRLLILDGIHYMLLLQSQKGKSLLLNQTF